MSERAEPISITVRWDVHRTSPNQRGHWRKRAQLTKAGREAATLAWHVAGRPVAPGPVRVTMVVRRPRVIDEDNAIGGSKCLRDALFNKAVTPSDSREFVQIGNVHFETGSHWKNREEVQFVIEDLRPEREAGAEREAAAKAVAAEAERAARTVTLSYWGWVPLLDQLKGSEFAGARKAIKEALRSVEGEPDVTVTFTAGSWAKLPEALRELVIKP